MKRYSKYVIFVMMLLGLFSVDKVLAANNKVTVSVNEEIKQAAPLGYGKDWISGYSFLSGNTESSKASEKYINGFKQANIQIPLLRMGGDSSNSYLWKSKLGDVGNRYGADFIINEGYLDYYLEISKITPEVQLLVAINLNDTVENNKDLIRFLTLNPDDEQAVGSDGTNWAQKRVDLGCPEPIPVYAFELGNELYPKEVVDTDVVRQRAQAYTNQCSEIIPQLREVNPNIKIASLMHSMAMITYFDSRGKQEKSSASIWNQTVINGLKNDIDYVVHHDYFGFRSTDRSTLNLRDTYYDVIENYLTGTDIGIILSETGYYTSGVEVTGSYGTLPNTNVLGMAFGLGRFYIKAYSMPRVRAIIHYGFSGSEEDGRDGSEWWISYRLCKDGAYRVSAAGMIANLFAKASSGIPVKTSVKYLNMDWNINVMAQAFKMPNGEINLIMIPDTGKENSPMTVDVAINGYTPVTKTVVSGAGYSADNTSATPFGVKESLEVQSGSSVQIPAYSAVSVKYVPNGNTYSNDGVGELQIVQHGSDIEVTDTLYKDVNIENLSSMSLMILKGNVEYQNATEDDIVAFGQAKLMGGKAYFKTQMPISANADEYKAVVGYNNIVHSKNFTYNASKIENVDIICNGNDVSVRARLIPGSIPAQMPVTVVYGENIIPEQAETLLHRVEFVGNLNCDGTDAILNFHMPDEALSGNYTLLIGDGGNAYTKVFEYKKADEKLRVLAVPQNSEQEIGIISDCSNIQFEARNLTENSILATAIASFYKDGRLVGVSKSTGVQIAGNDIGSFSINGNTYEADLVKLYIWDMSELIPYIRAYFVK